MTFAPDLVFGGLTALNTPGDLGDKLIAGTTSAVGGGIGGRLGTSLLPKGTGDGVKLMVDMAGGFGGDMVGQMVGDQAMRVKSPDGMTP